MPVQCTVVVILNQFPHLELLGRLGAPSSEACSSGAACVSPSGEASSPAAGVPHRERLAGREGSALEALCVAGSCSSSLDWRNGLDPRGAPVAASGLRGGGLALTVLACLRMLSSAAERFGSA
jgi:hypothetical protein